MIIIVTRHDLRPTGRTKPAEDVSFSDLMLHMRDPSMAAEAVVYVEKDKCKLLKSRWARTGMYESFADLIQALTKLHP